MNSSPSQPTDGPDSIPERLASAPTAQGMVVPYVTVAHRDRSRPVWGQLDRTRLLTALVDRLCQICGDPLEDPAVLYLRPADYLRGIAVEPATHRDCGGYSTRVCPMLVTRRFTNSEATSLQNPSTVRSPGAYSTRGFGNRWSWRYCTRLIESHATADHAIGTESARECECRSSYLDLPIAVVISVGLDIVVR